jgi:hypothetical protein
MLLLEYAVWNSKDWSDIIHAIVSLTSKKEDGEVTSVWGLEIQSSIMPCMTKDQKQRTIAMRDRDDAWRQEMLSFCTAVFDIIYKLESRPMTPREASRFLHKF